MNRPDMNLSRRPSPLATFRTMARAAWPAESAARQFKVTVRGRARAQREKTERSSARRTVRAEAVQDDA